MAFKRTYQSDGTERQFDVPFPYLRREHVKVEDSSGNELPFAWINEGRILLDSALPAGSTLTVIRRTPYEALHVVHNNQPVQALALNELTTQALYVAEEREQAPGGSVGSVSWGSITGKPTTFPPGAHGHDWGSVTGKPSTFPPSSHRHHASEIDGLPTAGAGGPVSWEDILNVPPTFLPSAHTHGIEEVDGLQAALEEKSPTNHTHEWSEVANKPATFVPAPHRHDASEIDNLPTGGGGGSTAWADLTGVPSAFPPEPHTHSWTQLSDRPALDFLPLTGGTLTGPLTVRGVRETVVVLGTVLSPVNGTVQTKTLTAATTLTEGAWADGEAVVVTYTGANTHEITHPAGWVRAVGFPTTLRPVQEVIYRKVGGVVRYSPGAGWAA